MPSRVAAPLGTPVARFAVWAVLVANIGITVTGALVRLTASGLGCPTWPLCTADSLVTTPEMGIHGAIEFGNRLLTFALLALTVLLFVVVARVRRERRDLWWWAIVLLAGIPLQAVVGGVSVWTHLNPYVVGLHFVISLAMTVAATIVVIRRADAPAITTARSIAPLAWVLGLTTAVTLLVGILTTGSGPHAGDATAPRNGLDSETLEHVHSWPAYASVGLAVVLAARATPRARRWFLALLAGFGAQIAVGIVQSHTGLPITLVAIHVALAMIITAIAATAIYRSTTSGSTATATKSAVK